MHGEDVPAVAAEGLREVDVLLVSGEAVEKDDGGMRLPCESMTVSRLRVGAEGFGSGSVVMALGCCAKDAEAMSRASVARRRVGMEASMRVGDCSFNPTCAVLFGGWGAMARNF